MSLTTFSIPFVLCDISVVVQNGLQEHRDNFQIPLVKMDSRSQNQPLHQYQPRRLPHTPVVKRKLKTQLIDRVHVLAQTAVEVALPTVIVDLKGVYLDKSPINNMIIDSSF